MADIYLIGDIASEGSGTIGLKQIMNAVNSTDDDTINLHIHSRGGDVTEGFAIYDFLINSGKTIITQIDGLCASIATVPLLAGSIRRMSPNAQVMIHNPWTGGEGDADQLQKITNEVRKAEDKIATFYSEKTGIDVEIIKDLMTSETYMTAEQALKLNYVTEILPSIKAYATIQTKNNNDMKEKLELLKNGIINLYNKINAEEVETPAAETPATEIKAMSKMTKDGKEVMIATEAEEMAVGDVVTVEGNPIPDSEIELEDGTVIKTDAESKIAEIVPMAEETTEAGVEALNAKIAELEKENEALKLQNSENETILAELSTKVEVMAKSITSNYKPVKEQNKFRKSETISIESRMEEKIKAMRKKKE